MRFSAEFSIKELYWVAGFLEGEGCFCFHKNGNGYNFVPKVTCGQKEIDPLIKVQKLFGGEIYYSTAKSRTNPIYIWNVGGSQAIALMMTVWSLMCERRRAQIKQVIDGWKIAPSKSGKYIRQFVPKPVRKPRKKFTDNEIREMRDATGTLREIAERFGTKKNYVFKLRKRERRANVL